MASGRFTRPRRLCTSGLQGLELVLVLCCALPVFAGEPSRDTKQEAKARFMAGQSHYNLNEFPAALVEFKEAYRLLPDPVFLYNSGQCERQLGHFEEAIRFYRSFLREQPKAPNRQDVLHKIEEMESGLKVKATETERNLAPPAPTASLGAATPAPAPAAAPTVPDSAPRAPVEPAPAEMNRPMERPAAAMPASPLSSPPVLSEAVVPAAPGLDVSSAPTTQPETASPAFYSRWWFWTAAGVVAAGAGVGIYAATASKGSGPPTSNLGSKGVF